MRRYERFVVLVCFLAVFPVCADAVRAEDQVKLSGDFETGLTLMQPGNELLPVSESKELENTLQIVLKPKIVGGSTSFESEFKIRKSLLEDTNPEEIIDQARFNWDIRDNLFLSVGKQRYSFGYSYFWTPTFTPNAKKQILEPEKETEGIPLWFLGYSGEVASTKLIWTLGETEKEAQTRLQDSYLGFQIDFYSAETEFYVNGFTNRSKGEMAGLGVRKGIAGWTFHLEGAALSTDAIKYYINPLTGEGFSDGSRIYYFKEKKPRLVFTSGVNKKVFGDGFLICEYYHNANGFTEAEFNDYVDSVIYFNNKSKEIASPFYEYYKSSLAELIEAYEPGFMQRNYLYLAYTHQIKNRWEIGLKALKSLDDGSSLVYPELSWEPAENLSVILELIFACHSKSTEEFGLFPFDNLASLKIKKFF